MTDRGRVPFALVGVLLLASSATLAPGLTRPDAPAEPAVDGAMDRLTAESRTAIRSGIRAAARRAAAAPVVDRASTRWGRVLNRSDPFRDALRVRVYRQVANRLAGLDGQRLGLTGTASLPAVRSPADLREALHRVSVRRAGPRGTRLAVTVRNVSLRVRRDGRVVGHRLVSPEFVVGTPVLAVHDRVDRYEELLSRGPVRPGLGRRLSASLYPVLWARGYAQYSGTPIQNVVANRHVALFTNRAALQLQRRVFGRSDPVGRRVLARALAGTALTDVLAGTQSPVLDHLERLRLRPDRLGARPSAGLPRPLANISGPAPDETTEIDVGRTADRAYLATLRDLDAITEAAYTVEVRRRAAVRSLGGQPAPAPPRPGPNWDLLGSSRSRTATVAGGSRLGRGAAGGRWHRLGGFRRTVTVTTTRERAWTRGGEQRRTTATGSRRYEVTVTLAGNHSARIGPQRGIVRVHTPGGPLDGRNLADVRRRAWEGLVRERGGADALARRAASGSLESRTATVTATRPATLSRWIARDLITLRERLAAVSVNTTRGKLATFQARPAKRLRSRVRERRTALAGVPGTYETAAHRSRALARVALVDRVRERLRKRARRAATSRRKARGTLADRSPGAMQSLQAGYNRRGSRPDRRPPGLRMQVDAAPAYLPRTAIDHDIVPAVPPGRSSHALVTKNTNVFTLPYGDAADAIVSAILGPASVRLRTAAGTLRAAARVAANGSGTALERRTARLRARLNHSLEGVAFGLGAELERAGLGDRAGRRAVVEAALGRYDTTSARALAATNGSLAARTVAAAHERWPSNLSSRVARDLLRLRLNATLRRHRGWDPIRPPQPLVNRTANGLREAVAAEAKQRLSSAGSEAARLTIQRELGRTVSRLPSGLPLAPAPGLWYATVNVWHVEVGGEYAQFVVRVPTGAPTAPGGTLAYIRDGDPVRIDLDGDGSLERLGRARRITFRAETWLGIAVPPGLPGVGDVDGQYVETSAGWPSPGRE